MKICTHKTYLEVEVFFNSDQNSSNRVSINGGLVPQDSNGGIIARGIGVKTVWIKGFMTNSSGCKLI
jgi:hypothetical protein